MTRSKHTAEWAISWLVVASCVGACSDPSDSFSNDGQAGAGDGQEAGDAGGPSGTGGDGMAAGGQGGALGRRPTDGSDVTNERTGGTGGTGTGTAGDTDVIEGESAGSGGVGGQAGGSAGGLGTGGVQDCGRHAEFGPLVFPTYSQYDLGVDGPAVVERSAGDELVLALGRGVAGAGGADSSTSLPSRLAIAWPGPSFPVGAQVSVSRDGSRISDVMYGWRPWALSVRDPGGVLLFGAFWNAAASPAAPPLSIGTVTPYCTAAYQDNCAGVGAIATYNEVEVRGDTTVVARDSETVTLALDGIPYDVYVTSREVSAGQSQCIDYHPGEGVALDIRAQDLASRVSELPIGTLPDCAVGNDPEPPMGFWFTNIDDSAAYDLTVSYVGRDARPDSLDFDIPDVPGAKLSIDGAARFLPEPPLGQRLWLSHQAMYANALLDAEGGAPLLAVVYADSPQSPPSDWLRSVLGVTVTAEQRCLYADNDPYGETWLWDFVFGTEPPVRVSTGSAASLDLGGQPYVAWFWGQSSIWLVLYRDQ